jgi:LysR family transcriptional activator for leuABCD operon
VLNLRSIDLNLLPVFEAAYEERNLSRAADRLAMTQSAVSHALSRLRSVFQDELFVRQARGVFATPVADVIYTKLRSSLASVRESVAERRGFDPKLSARRFFVGVAHPLGPMISVRLLERLARDAPGVEVAFSTRSRPIELERSLAERRVDAAVDWVVPERGQFRDVTLFEDSVVAVARQGHPALRRVRSLKDLKEGTFVSLRPRVDIERAAPGIIEWRRLNLKIALEVSELLEVFMVTGQSDLFGLIPRSMLRFARESFGLRPLAARPTAAPVAVKLVWHASQEADPAHAFLRKQIGLACNDVVPRGSR